MKAFVKPVIGISVSLAMFFAIPALVGLAFLCAGFHDICPIF